MLFVRMPERLKSDENSKPTREAIHSTTVELIEAYISFAKKFHIDYLIDAYYQFEVYEPYKKTAFAKDPNPIKKFVGKAKAMFNSFYELDQRIDRSITSEYIDDYKLSDRDKSLLSDGMTAFIVVRNQINKTDGLGIILENLTHKPRRGF